MIAPTAIVTGSSRIRMIDSASIGSTWTSVDAVHDQPISASRPASMRGRQWTAAVSGNVALTSSSGDRGGAEGLHAFELPAGDRAAEDHEVGVERQSVHLLGAALAVIDHRVVALVELGAQRGDGAFDRRRI